MKFTTLTLSTAFALPLVFAAGAATAQFFPFGGTQNTYLCHSLGPADQLGYKAQVEDQFGDSDFEILRATLICNPVLEGGFEVEPGKGVEQFRLADEDVHYICFDIRLSSTDAGSKDFEVDNQLERNQQYISDEPSQMCVPTLKAH